MKLTRVIRRLNRVRLHQHGVDPDLSALVAFPSCRCGALMWPADETSSAPETADGPRDDADQPHRPPARPEPDMPRPRPPSS